MEHLIKMANVATLVLGLWPNKRGLQGCGPRGSLGFTPHVPGSVGKYEGMNLHTPTATPTLGTRVPMNFRIFKGQLQGSKTQWLEKLFISLESSWNIDVQNGLTLFIWNLKHKLWPKEGVGVKLALWLLTIKSQESTRLPYVQWHATCLWKALNEGYNFALDLISIEGLHAKL
jgi:hypothetical protein